MKDEKIKAAVLQEPGCKAMILTCREDDPHELVFFEIFSSQAAHMFHLQKDYTKSSVCGGG